MPLARIRQYPLVEPFETLQDAEEALRKLTAVLQEEATKRTEDFRTEHIATLMKARAYLSANQTNITDTTWTKVLLDSESYDPGNHFASYKYTVTVPGSYLIHGQIRVDDTDLVADKSYTGGIKINGTTYVVCSEIIPPVGGVLPTIPLIGIHPLDVDDYIEMHFHHDAGNNNIDIYGAAGGYSTFMEVHLLST